MPFVVPSPGWQTLPVARGRVGRRHLGVPLGGAADRGAHAIANALVGNGNEVVSLEIAGTGPTLIADDFHSVAIVGAPFEIACGDRTVEPNSAFAIRAGEVLRIGGTPIGLRAYLAITGGFRGLQFEMPLNAGVRLEAESNRRYGRNAPEAWPMTVAEAGMLRILPGLQRDWFEEPSRFEATTWTVAASSNRMGIRLTGDVLRRVPREMISEPVAPGSVQVANDGQPIILGVDGQTIGGYPKIAHVIDADLDRLAQLRPGETIRFRLVDEQEAETARRQRKMHLDRWITRLRL